MLMGVVVTEIEEVSELDDDVDDDDDVCVVT
jgi:hypothetical protein